MIGIKVVTLGIILLASKSLGNICSGRWNGDQVPNPSDCKSFYVCDYGEPKLFKCLDHLLYDPVQRVCNWAYLVACGAPTTTDHVPILPNPPYYPQLQPELEQPGTWNSPGVNLYPTQSPQYQYSPNPGRPPVVQFPDVPGFSESEEYFPGLVESLTNVFHCTNPDFYFAPHPRHCGKYFICENYRIHNHQCGDGIYWDYVYNQCDFAEKSFCYSDETHNEVPTEHPTFATTIALQPGNWINCSGSQTFVGDPQDCRRYYICIGDLPIATSCPEQMAWDKNVSQCNEDAWLECNGGNAK
ncbi:putative chitinase 10 [Pseudolycoriella hygida]|uniref:Chitinase 10 n=1 Tax=Pseudolycoriella hygida TaxID=35572 RepID=A0A9Q0N2U6_9DIPT|nr:putative chitinase 10 [Pseudolycoriella hygida]